MSSFIKKEKYLIVLIFFSLFFSTFKINNDVNKFDKYLTYNAEETYHAIISSPPERKIWEKAAEVKDEFSLSNPHPYEYRHHFLPSKILGFFGKITKLEFYENDLEKKYSSGNKLKYFMFQTLIYFSSVIFLYFKLKKVGINRSIALTCIFFLLLEPSINQFQSTILGETIFFALIIFIFAFLIDLSNKNYYYFFYGLLIGICFLQRSVALFLVFVPIIYIIFIYKKNSILKVLNLTIAFSLILIVLGFINFKRSQIFYFLPTQTIDTPYTYFVGPDLKEMENIEIENNLDRNIESDNIIYHKEKRKIAIRKIKDDKMKYFVLFIKKSLHSTLLNPTEVRNVRLEGKDYYKSDLHKEWVFYRILYSSLIYLIIILGFLYSIKNKLLIPNLFALLGLSIFIASGWVGYTRYWVPSFLCLSLYFSYGFFVLNNSLKNGLKKYF
tara:strand:+ start:95 stop:1417 length:1323 start_codon:yes stop_codon:yes gene_type:complete